MLFLRGIQSNTSFLKVILVFHSNLSLQNDACFDCFYLCRNVPYDWINTAKANQRWMQKQGEKFIFPGGGTMFPNGVGEYLDQMEELIPGMKDGTIRTALDTGCGVGV